LTALLLVLAVLPVGSAAEEAAAAPQVAGGDAILADEVAVIAAQVERLREERFARPPVAVRTPDDMRRIAAESRALNVLSRGRLAARGRAWADVGLGTEESPRRLLLALALDLRDVGFDPQGNRLLVSQERLLPEDFEPTAELTDPATVLMLTGVRPDEPLIAHALTHVRQRERTGGDPMRETTDHLLASMAWAEGEANLVAMRFLFEGMNLADEILRSNLHPGQVLDGGLLPPGLDVLSGVDRGFLEFVYLEGFERAVAAYRSGGWKALNDAMARSSTRDLLHPGGGAARVPEFETPAAPAIEGLRLADEDVLGEQAIVVLVSSLTGKDSLGLVAGAGWIGDRLRRWEREGGGDGITDWVTRWSDAESAAEFDYALGRTLATRFPGREVAGGMLAAGGRVFRVTRGGDEVRLRVAPADWDARLQAGAAGG
jgi:hypothetical protein